MKTIGTPAAAARPELVRSLFVLNSRGATLQGEYKSPKLDGDKLTFNVQTLEGDLSGGDGSAAVLIDIIGRPFTPLSLAGVARRTAFLGALYAGGAGATYDTAAYGAAAYGAPYIYPYARTKR